MMTETVARHMRRLRGDSSERGSAMVMVMGIMLVGAIVGTTLAALTMYNTSRTFENKQAAQALQSADAGLDITFSQLEGLQYNELWQVCGGTYTLNDDEVVVTTEYTVTSGGTTTTTSCPTSSQIVTSLRITSTATTAPLVLGDGEELTRTSVATLMPVPPQVVLDKAVFTEGTTTITNNSELLESAPGEEDAHVYSNGGLNCATQNEIQGQIIAAHGDITFPNNCKIHSSVWASGRVVFNTGAEIYGNVYAASDDSQGIDMENQGYIEGSALTNGGIYTAAKQGSSRGIHGIAFARTGGIEFRNDAYIGGSAYAGDDIDVGNGGRIGGDAVAGVDPTSDGDISGRGSIGRHATLTGSLGNQVNVGGTESEGQSATSFTSSPYPAPAFVFPAAVGYPNEIQVPPREQMPRMSMGPDDILLWEAAGYVTERYSSPSDCSGSRPEDILNGNVAVPPNPGISRLIIFDGCTGPVTFTNQTRISIDASVAMVSNTGFRTENRFEVTTNAPSGSMYQMHWIVPSDAPHVTWNPTDAGQTTPVCSPSNTGNIYFGNNVMIDTVETLAYTPCEYYQQNGWNRPWIGQIYAGKVTLQNGFLLQMTKVPVPSLSDSEADPTSVAEMQLLSRFDEYSS